MGVIKMDKEYLDLICDNEGEEEVKIAKDFELDEAYVKEIKSEIDSKKESS